MSNPITQEALREAGWKHIHHRAGMETWWITLGMYHLKAEFPGDTLWIGRDEMYQRVKGVRTMSDLSTLVQLLTAAPQPGEGGVG